MTLKENIIEIGHKAKIAASHLSTISGEIKKNALKKAANQIKENIKEIIKKNTIDVDNAIRNSLSPALIDRLTLDISRVNAMAESMFEIAELPEPIGKILSEWERPNGLKIQKVTVPLGVIGMIYESRANVTADASALGIKSGNAVILRGGKDSFHSSLEIFNILNESFNKSNLPKHSIQIIPVLEREAVDEMLKLNNYIDIIIPRGGKNLIEKVNKISTIPVIKHLDGICHLYIDADANLEIAKKIIFNSKMRRPGICGAVETLLIDEKLSNYLPELLNKLKESNCEIRGDERVCSIDESFKHAEEKDWDTEYLDKIISVRLVKGVDEAINHICKHSSHHTESIVTENNSTCEKFFKKIDSAIILQNASTQYADGGEFGFGAEIGISTGKLHVRGPVGAQHLTSFKYLVYGNGQVRP